MKKLLAILLASAVSVGTFAFVGCGDNSSAPDNSQITKPTAPTDSNMQTVSGENFYNECVSYYKQLTEKEFGSYQAYSLTEMVSSGKDVFDGENEKVKYTAKTVDERSDVYSGIKENNSKKAAVTHHETMTYDKHIDSTNPNLASLNMKQESKSVLTGIQKDAQLYGFMTYDLFYNEGEEVENVKVDRHLRFYEDCVAVKKTMRENIPCVYALDRTADVEGLAIKEVLDYFYFVGQYEASGSVEWLIDQKLVDPEIVAVAEKVQVKNFELTSKKNDEKFFANAKYTVELTISQTDNATTIINGEYSALINLSKPSAKELPSNGINIDKLSLSSAASNMPYLDLTSKQLTTSVEQGNGVSLEIAGNGDKENFDVRFSYNNSCPVSNGWVSINCEDIRSYIDEIKQAKKEYGIEYEAGEVQLACYYEDEKTHMEFKQYIDIDY